MRWLALWTKEEQWLYLDFSKAFVTIFYDIHTAKTGEIWFGWVDCKGGGKLAGPLDSKCDEWHRSDWQLGMHGNTQRLIVRQMLFKIAINNLVKRTECNISKLMDDTKLGEPSICRKVALPFRKTLTAWRNGTSRKEPQEQEPHIVQQR